MTRKLIFVLPILISFLQLPVVSAQGNQLYEPAATYDTGRLDGSGRLQPDLVLPDQITYVTAGGFVRRVPVAIWIPHNARGPLPVVIWAHGKGARTGDNPEGSMSEWSKTSARAGYLSIAVTHVENAPLDRLQLCRAIGYGDIADPGAVASALHDLINAQLGAGAGNLDVSGLIARFPALFSDMLGSEPPEGLVSDDVMARLLEVLEGCRVINNLGIWDRLYDIRAVINALTSGAYPPLNGLVDTERIAVAGHSNGSSSVLQAAGMIRALPNGVPVLVPESLRPIAAVALSPMGPNEFGLFDTAAIDDRADPKMHSWQGLDLPVFSATGDGDEGCKPHRFECGGGDTGSTRRIPFERMPASNKYLMYIGDRSAPTIVSSHGLFGLGDQCPEGAQTACQTTKRWLQSSVLAFLDAHVRGVARAQAWLRSDAIERASGGIVDLLRK